MFVTVLILNHFMFLKKISLKTLLHAKNFHSICFWIPSLEEGLSQQFQAPDMFHGTATIWMFLRKSWFKKIAYKMGSWVFLRLTILHCKAARERSWNKLLYNVFVLVNKRLFNFFYVIFKLITKTLFLNLCSAWLIPSSMKMMTVASYQRWKRLLPHVLSK